ncbi:hypothetical protein MRB53_001009 [Persea americana]|uniref:Uncharacterized protein n=1 Tax=Persea americana TaxID=3435 RepID=A0ACC2MQM4_PERAE|nr:hypothetical protein MRB53_001009 [Persea americana]
MEEDGARQSTPIFSRSCTWTGPTVSNSTLCDSYEIRAISQNLERAINQQSPSMGPTKTHLQIQPRTPTMLRSSPWNGGSSTLYDSYELKTVTQQLSKALHAQERASPYLGYLASPLYAYRRRCMEHLYKESGKSKTPKRVGCGRVAGRGVESRGSGGGVVPRLWKKIKRTFLWRRKQE